MIYKLKFSTKGIGAFPQIQKLPKNYNFEAKDSIYNMIYSYDEEKELSFTPDFNFFEVSEKANITDCLSSMIESYLGFFVSENILINLFGKLSIPLHQIFEVNLFHKNQKLENFYFFYLVDNMYQYIDWNKSKFYIGNYSGFFKSNVNFSSLEEIKVILPELRTKAQMIVPISLFFRETTKKYDIFRIGLFNHQIYVTEKFKEEYESQNLTGLTFKELTPDVISLP